MIQTKINSVEVAKKHAIRMQKPAVNFFEGALLGNGGLGAVVCTRPDAIMIHLGHNNVWDIRISEKNRDKIGKFQDVLNNIKTMFEKGIDIYKDDEYKKYLDICHQNYEKPYPRPFPCGTLVLKFDRRKYELIGHSLDISCGLCKVEILANGNSIFVEIFVQQDKDCVWIRSVNKDSMPVNNPFDRIHLMPDPIASNDIPPYQLLDKPGKDTIYFKQVLPYDEPDVYDAINGNAKDRALAVHVKTCKQIDLKHTHVKITSPMLLEGTLSTTSQLVLSMELTEGLSANTMLKTDKSAPSNHDFIEFFNESKSSWHNYWCKSGVLLEDEILEKTWYHNLYFLNCSVKQGVRCPGLFANWSYKNIGTAWHGDYHMNYNTQQPFWVCFSSNHIDKHLPYVELVNNLLPISKKWAKEYYEINGAYFPHCAYPVEMSMNSYPEPGMAWEICETPFTVQSIWWHYLYSMDVDFLKNYGYEPLKEAVIFLVEYMTRPDAYGDKWGDDKYHIFPTMVPELYGITNEFIKNYDCITDLTLTKFVFNAYIDCCSVLGINETEHSLIEQIKDVLLRFPDNPCADVGNGKIFTCVPQEQEEVVYNCPVSTMTVFPGEEHGLHSPKEEYEIAVNTFNTQQNEGGNELVFLNLQGARLGILDLEKFKRQIKYCLLPNGTCSDMFLQVNGRYNDTMPFDALAPMGIWFENFSLPVVINECLIQSYTGIIRLFPNWPNDKYAEFYSFRAVGAFLVSAAFDKEVLWIKVHSEIGGIFRFYNPWDSEVVFTIEGKRSVMSGDLAEIILEKDQKVLIKKA